MNASNSTNSTYLNGSATYEQSLLIKVIKTTAYCIVLLLSVIGNGLIIAVFYRRRKMRSSINLFICSMSASDIVMEMMVIPLRIKDVFHPQGRWFVYGVLGNILCKVIPFLYTATIIVSIVTMLIIAVERFFSVVFPLKRPLIRTRGLCFALVAFSWFFSALSASPNLIIQKLIKLDNIYFCDYSWEPVFNHLEAVRVELSIFFVLFTIIPFILLTGLYTAVIVSLYYQKGGRHLASEQLRRRAQENKRVTMMLLAVVVIFLLSWMPINVYVYISLHVLNKHLPAELRNFQFAAMFLSYTYPAINPFIYYVFNEHYRSGIHEILSHLCWNTRRQNREETSMELHNLRVTVDSRLSLASTENQNTTAGQNECESKGNSSQKRG